MKKNNSNVHSQPIRITEACKYLGISKNYMYKLTSKRLIKYTKPLGKNIYFKKEDLDEFAFSNEILTMDELEIRALSKINELKKKHSRKF